MSEPETLNATEIMRLLPHRYPFLLLDRVLELELGTRLVALKNVTLNEPFFPGHFPNYPVMPGVLIVEAMAQASAVLGFRSTGTSAQDDNVYLFVGIDKARFRQAVQPGDQLRIEVQLKRAVRGIWMFTCSASVDGTEVASAEIMCTLKAIT
ncbi:3-hydroxyacyl-ACP dehydratase FabZ [Immundisolibacter sp.]|jgi:3-hydroxyacyl-[acyl-carrier-protein] dehydratase|uniref:3-hydroxyacyl-ACP dehydratase FabZ n=1 Tax=Immundisolibacter sp. TaxID=1934948 RepID=UPI00199D890D|nr:3-hydroxyacyl-ACP dehydratase FabZ [Immundisolibacter sp.]MBC7161718.1 3-hydroxyacyl-ACP dehydratase FabZ [Immundisolibacter sp.]MEA3220374.1 3-hydroxyacyl-[acyl-carrier-protein] dehydratase FabZ [Immundisolibacter sp.]